MTNQSDLFKYLLHLGDNALIHSYRLSELCSRGPFLEEDLALTNIALDQIGRAQSFLKYAGEIEGKGRTEDDLAYKRGERQFYNHLITELPNGDFAYTIAKQLILSTYDVLLFTELSNSKDETIAGISSKVLKEVRYHFVHARDWCYRLGLGTDVSHTKLQNAINEIWMFSGELFESDETYNDLYSKGIAVNSNSLKAKWLENITEVLTKSEINIPNVDYMQSGGKQGIHTEYLGHLLTEMQYLQRAYPNAKW